MYNFPHIPKFHKWEAKKVAPADRMDGHVKHDDMRSEFKVEQLRKLDSQANGN